MKILVTGASGQLGHEICSVLQEQSVPHRGLSSEELDITDAVAVKSLLQVYRPDAVIHCAAWTAVDAAQEHEEVTMAVNARGTRNLVLSCKEVASKLLYLSTDYVFSGQKSEAYQPEDIPKPLNVYGQSKLAGEQAILENLNHYFIVRTSWMFGVHGKNFVDTMLCLGRTKKEISVVDDQIGTPTYARDLAVLLCDMVKTERYGIYHATNEGRCSWAEFAEEIFRQSRMPVYVRHVCTAEFGAKAVRPINSVMDTSGLEKAGFSRLPSWRDALSRYLQERKEKEQKG